MVVDLIDDLVTFDRKIKSLTKQIREAVEATGTHVTDIVGVGPVIAAVILGEIGDVSRSRVVITSPASTAPLHSRHPAAT